MTNKDVGITPITIDSIKSPTAAPERSPDVITSLELSQIKVAELEQKNLKLEIDNRKQDKKLRKKYAKYTFWLIAAWLIGIFGIVIAVGRGYLMLPASVLNTMIGSTTIGILGLFGIVANYLFPRGRWRDKR